MSDSAAPNPARAAEAQDREDHPPADDFIGSERASPIGWLFLKSPRATRLLGDLQGSYAQLHRRRNAEALTRADRQHVSTALVLCRASLRSLKRERIEEGWIALHAAKRTEVLAMTEAELGPLALALKKEGEDKAKFRNWRGAAIACLADQARATDFLKRWLDARFQVSDRAAMTWFYVAIATMGALGAIASALRSFSSTGDDQEATERRATERLFVRTIESASAEQKREERSSDR